MLKNIYDVIAGQQLYYKRTDGGAEYLCTKPVQGSMVVGDISTAVIRLDGGTEVLDNYANQTDTVKDWLVA